MSEKKGALAAVAIADRMGAIHAGRVQVEAHTKADGTHVRAYDRSILGRTRQGALQAAAPTMQALASAANAAVRAPFDFAGDAVRAGGFSKLPSERVGRMGLNTGLGNILSLPVAAARGLPPGTAAVLSAGGAIDKSAGTKSLAKTTSAEAPTAPAILIPKRKITVNDPYRTAYPGIYGNPKDIAAEAASRVAPESENLKKVFGVTREELAEINQHGTRQGNLDPASYLKEPANPRGSASALAIMTRRNENRILDVLEEAGKHRDLRVGMDNWYVMDPAYHRLAQLVGKEAAAEVYRRKNAFIGMASPGSEVLTEIGRGSLAYHLDTVGRFPDFVKHGGNRESLAKIGVTGVDGHPYHKTSQAVPMQQYVDAGYEMQHASAKVPSYVHASGVPATGFQTRAAVPDAHWSRFVGLADVRKGPTDVAASASVNEMALLRPWWPTASRRRWASSRSRRRRACGAQARARPASRRRSARRSLR